MLHIEHPTNPKNKRRYNRIILGNIKIGRILILHSGLLANPKKEPIGYECSVSRNSTLRD